MSALQSFLFEVRNPTLLRVAIATLAAPPLAMAVCGIVVSVAFSKTAGGALTLGKVIGTTSLYGSVFAYLVIALVGLPTFLVLKGIDAQRGVAYLFVGTISLPLLLSLKSAGLPSHDIVASLFLAATPGCLVAGCWWLLASR